MIAAWFALVLRPLAAQDGSSRPEAARPVSGLAQRRIVLSGRYLNLPVKTGAPLRTIDLVVGGKVVREIPIEFAAGEPRGTDIGNDPFGVLKRRCRLSGQFCAKSQESGIVIEER